MEEFRDIPGYEGLYQVSNLGRVKSLPREVCNGNRFIRIKERILKKCLSKGYYHVGLHEDGKQKLMKVHQLVAMAFLNHTPCGLKMVVDHINNNPLDNRLENLQVITQRENSSKDVKNKTSKYTGVMWSKKNWVAQIYIDKKIIVIGYFNCELAAHQAYQKALEDFNNGKEITRNVKSFTNKYKGVYYEKKRNKWQSLIQVNGKRIHLGYFEKEFDAHVAYQNKLLSLNN